MTRKPINLPPELLNRLSRSQVPMVADLKGPGPFQLPLLTHFESMLGPTPEGHLEIRMETAPRQEVRIRLTEEAASMLSMILKVHFLRQAEAASKKPKS